MKGVELPISTLIVIVIALVIFLAILMLFYGSWGPGSTVVNLEAAKDSACHMLLSLGCTPSTNYIVVNNFDADRDGEIDPGSGWVGWDSPHPDPADNDNLASLCWYHFSIRSSTGETDCKDLCNC